MKKKKRIKIKIIDDFNEAISKEKLIISHEEKIEIEKILNEGITYKVNDVSDFIEYIDSMKKFEKEHYKLCEKIKSIKMLKIHRTEFERIPTTIDDVSDILIEVNKIKDSISEEIDTYGEQKLNKVEVEIDKNYIYAKDIELLKRMISINNESITEIYNKEKEVKTVSIKVPQKIGYEYVKSEKGSVEYHEHIKSYIPRLKRLINNLDKYLIKKEEGIYEVNQSSAVQDTVNIAIAVLNNIEFRAISGKNDIEESCSVVPIEDSYFQSCKVNKLGVLGRGYNRINDSEKKILEEIHKQIECGAIKDSGLLVMYSMWEPCLSCYYVINQFVKKYPLIDVKVKFHKEYGEK